MAEKRGQYQYHDDGTTSQLVSGGVSLEESAVIIPTDVQAILAEPVVMLAAKPITAGSWDATSTYTDVQVFSKLAVKVKADVSCAYQVDLYWSADQSTVDNVQTIFNGTGQFHGAEYPTLGSYVKIAVKNGDAASRTFDAKFRKKTL